MDQEVSRGTWLGSSLLMLVASIGLALVVYGLSRPVANSYIDSLSKTLLDSNYEELVQLNGTTTALTHSAVIGLVERNNRTITKVTFVPTSGGTVTLPNNLTELTSHNVMTQLSTYGMYTTYNTYLKLDARSGTAEVTVYIGR